MSRTGGFGVAGLLREELIRELFTDTESLFHPSTGLQGRPAVVPDRQRFNWPLAISQICNQPAATPAALQNVTFRRTGGISPSSVRLEALMGAPAAGIRLGISAALVDNALAATNVSLQSLPANSVRFDFDLVLGAIAEDAPLLDPILGLPFYFPRPSSEYSEGFRLSSRIYYEDASDPDDIDKNILVGSTGQVFRNPFVRGKGEDRPLVHQNGDPLTTITIGSVFLDNLEHITQVTVFSFESPAFVQPLNLQTSPGPADAFGRAYCLIDPNEPNTQAALALVATAQANVAAGVPGADNLLFLANISVFGRRVAEVVPIPHIWLQATAVSLSTYNSGFLTGIVQPCQPVAGGPITNLNLSVAADFGTLLGHLAPRAFATPFAPLALQVEALGEDHPFAFSNRRTEIAVKTFQPGEPNEKRALVIGTSVDDDPPGQISAIDDTLFFSDFAFNISEGVVNKAFDRARGTFAKDFDTSTRDLREIKVVFGNDRMEVKTRLKWWVVGSKNTEIQDAIDVNVSNIFIEPRAFKDYAKDEHRRPVDACAVPIADLPSTQAELEDPSNPVCYFAFVYRRDCPSPLECIPAPDQLTTAGKRCVEQGHDRDFDGKYDAPNDLKTDQDDDNDGLPDDAEARDIDHDGRYGEREIPADDVDRDGRFGEYEDCDLDDDGRPSEFEIGHLDYDNDGRSGEVEPQPFFHAVAPMGPDNDGDFRRCEDEFPGEDLDGDGRIGEQEERFGDLNSDGDSTDGPDPDDDGDGILDGDDVDPTYRRSEVDGDTCPPGNGLITVGTGGAVLTRCRGLFFPEARKIPDFQAFSQLEHIRGLTVGFDASDPHVSVGNGIVGAIISSLDFFFNGGLPLVPVGNLLGHPGRIEKRDGPFSFLLISLLEALVPSVLRSQLKDLQPKNSEDQLVALFPIAPKTDLALFVTGINISQEAFTIVGRSVVLHSLLNPTQTQPVNCAIATAAYGTPLAAEIECLREFRDRVLMRSRLGRRAVRRYYLHAPGFARWISRRPAARAFARAMLRPVIAAVRLFLSRAGEKS